MPCQVRRRRRTYASAPATTFALPAPAGLNLSLICFEITAGSTPTAVATVIPNDASVSMGTMSPPLVPRPVLESIASAPKSPPYAAVSGPTPP